MHATPQKNHAGHCSLVTRVLRTFRLALECNRAPIIYSSVSIPWLNRVLSSDGAVQIWAAVLSIPGYLESRTRLKPKKLMEKYPVMVLGITPLQIRDPSFDFSVSFAHHRGRPYVDFYGSGQVIFYS